MATSWQNSNPTAYSAGSFPYYTTTDFSIIIDGNNTVYGEWVEINIPVSSIIYSYTFGTSAKNLLPTSWIIVGSNARTGPWSSIPNTTNNSGTTNIYTIPSSVITSYGTDVIPPFTINVNSTIPYSCYRIIFISAYSNTLGIGINSFYIDMYSFIKVTTGDLPLTDYVMYYPLTPITGTTLYNGITKLNDGTVVGNPSISTTTFIVSPASLQFVRTSAQYVRLSNITLTTNFSISIWFNFSNIGYNQNIFCLTSDTGSRFTNNIVGFISTAGALVLTLFNGGYNAANGDQTISSLAIGKWHHLVWVVNSTTWTVYLNGNIATPTTRTGMNTVPTPNRAAYIGIGFGTDYFNGYCEEFRIYSRSLTTTEVTTLYNYRG